MLRVPSPRTARLRPPSPSPPQQQDHDVQELEHQIASKSSMSDVLSSLPSAPYKMAATQSHPVAHSVSDSVDVASWIHEFEEEHEEDAEHRHQWFSEFSDLVFVAIIINFADNIKNMTVNYAVDPDTNAIVLSTLMALILEASLFFLAFFTVWYELSVTLIRFSEIDGILDDILKWAYLAGIVTMTL